MFATALIMSAALAAAPAPAEASKPVTILLDQTDQCGIGRVAYDQRAQSRRKAEALKRKLEKEGREVRLVILHPGTKLDGTPGPLVMNPAC
ncbi:MULTISPECIES: hypothetical protein [unclassified Sphingobium]|uniref:hypothetical protein n=1 Tax=unclassified Sphingobium TaxID=2611147 RepID=UPI0022259E4D|nr:MULTISPECIES: hypothetical protein [unclassified Sphingobium]MCW2395898.1 hypothetical protein [Sphingobium sp. B8D3B]MCW2419414.1 hypothetical protein [Sphingobium sp. B8D3C]